MISPSTTAGWESPSLYPPGKGPGGAPRAPAFELKFLVDEGAAREAEAWAGRHLAPDPHGDPALGGAYSITSLYCDTPRLDVYWRTPTYKRHKFRARRYGSAPWVFLERKSKWGDRVEKCRTSIPGYELHFLAHPASPADWGGHWFHHCLRESRLAPACEIAYRRTAYYGSGPEGPLRMTLDRGIRGVLMGEWTLDPFEGGLPLLVDRVILEFKFRSAFPSPFKGLMQDLRISPCGVSKYRLCREAWGVPSRLQEAPDA